MLAAILVTLFPVVLCQYYYNVTTSTPNTQQEVVVQGTGFPFMQNVPVHHPNVIHFIGAGYNILRGNPDGESWNNVGDDPGLRMTRKMLLIGQGEAPPQIEIEHRDSCQSSHSYNLIYNTKSYQDRLLTGIYTSGETDAVLKPYAFTLSSGYNAVLHQLSPPINYVFQDYTTYCDMGHARLRSHLVSTDRFSVSREFASAVCNDLTDDYQSPNYMKFIEEWGTHMITEVEVGKKITYRYQTTKDKYFSFLLANVTHDVRRGVGNNGSVLTVDLDVFKYRKEYRDQVGVFHDSFGVGNPQYNDEIGLTMISIESLFDSQYWSYMDYLIQQGVCGHDAPKSLPKWKANLITALKFYPTFKTADLPTGGPLQIPLVWPTGSYTLPKANIGCPDGFHWSEGRVTMNEPGGQKSPLGNLDGEFEQTSFTLNYCSKERNESPYELLWPKGDYCIFQQNSQCPTGFTSSSIRYQDNVKPKLEGVTPTTAYTTGVQYLYCCRSDGSYLTPIYLPTSKPFYLLKNKHGCQSVDGLRVQDQYFMYPTSHTIFVHNPPSHATVRGKSVSLDYCYYQTLQAGSVVGK